MTKFENKKMTKEREMAECQYRHGNRQCHIPPQLCEYENECRIWVKEAMYENK